MSEGAEGQPSRSEGAGRGRRRSSVPWRVGALVIVSAGILLAIWSWESRWVPERLHDLPKVSHRGCGEVLSVVVVCARSAGKGAVMLARG